MNRTNLSTKSLIPQKYEITKKSSTPPVISSSCLYDLRYLNLKLFFIIFCLFFSCSKKDIEKKDMPTALEYIENFKMKHTKDGKAMWELKAKTATYLSEDIVELTDIEMRFFSDSKKSIITAATARINQKTSDIETSGVTTLKSKDKTIYTTDVRFSSRENKIYTNKNVEIITEDARIKGTSMVSDPMMESIVLTDQTVVWKK